MTRRCRSRRRAGRSTGLVAAAVLVSLLAAPGAGAHPAPHTGSSSAALRVPHTGSSSAALRVPHTRSSSAALRVPQPAPDPAALARLPLAPDALPGLRPLGPCPAGRAPTGLDAFSPGTDPEPSVPGGGAGQLVAVVDTGVAAHPRLAGRVVDGGDFVAGRSGLDDCDGHGTVVAGLLAAAPSPTDLVEGVVPAARVLAVRQSSAWFAAGAAPGAGDVTTLARAVRAAAATPGVGVMTLALAACLTPEQATDPALAPALGALRAAVRDAADRGVVLVAAAGNVGGSGGCAAQNTDTDLAAIPVPGWFDDDVLTVGAEEDGRADPASLRGPWVDVAAPGSAAASLDARGPGLTVALTAPDGASSPLVGTSEAVARAAGVAAAVRARDPALPARAVIARIERTARPAAGPAETPATAAASTGDRDPAVGAGIVDAAAAVADAPATPASPTDPSGGAPGASTGPSTLEVLALVVVVLALGGAAVVVLLRRRRPR